MANKVGILVVSCQVPVAGGESWQTIQNPEVSLENRAGHRCGVLVRLLVLGVICCRPTHFIVVVIPAASQALQVSFIRLRGQRPGATLGAYILVHRLTVGTEPDRGAHAKVVFITCPAPRHSHFLPSIRLGSLSACRGSARWRAGRSGVTPIMQLVRRADNTRTATCGQLQGYDTTCSNK